MVSILGRELYSKCVSLLQCVSMCVFLNICSSLALLSLLYMAHPCSGCWTPPALLLFVHKKGEEDRDGARRRPFFCSHAVLKDLFVKGLASVDFCKLHVSYPRLFSPRPTLFSFSSFPSAFLPWPCSLRPPPSRQQMLGLRPDVFCLSLSGHIFNKLSNSKHLQRRLLSSALLPHCRNITGRERLTL